MSNLTMVGYKRMSTSVSWFPNTYGPVEFFSMFSTLSRDLKSGITDFSYAACVLSIVLTSHA